MSLMESYFRLSINMSAEVLLVQLPLAALDSGIVCWIFSALTQTTRALRLRRYHNKLILRYIYMFINIMCKMFYCIFYLKECCKTPIVYSFYQCAWFYCCYLHSIHVIFHKNSAFFRMWRCTFNK